MKAPSVPAGYLAEAGELPGCRLVDDRTASDLDLDAVFRAVDRTRSTAGGALLYALLRNQPRSRAARESGARLSGFFAADPAAREAARRVLGKLGRQARGDLPVDLFDPGPKPFGRLGALYRLEAAATVLALAWLVLTGAQAAVLACIAIAACNVWVYARTNPVIDVRAGSVFYLCGVVKAAETLSARVLPESLPERAALAEGARELGKVRRWTAWFGNGKSASGDVFALLLDYFRIFFLMELTSYLSVHAFVARRAKAVRALYEAVGSADAWAAVADYLASGEGARPAVVSESPDGLAATGLVHPLVRDCVPNDLEFRRGVVLTGANMSGKSTFLRTLGVNQVLATSLGFAFATSFRSSYYEVLSSVGGGDDPDSGRSRYLVEAERLLAVVRAVDSGDLVLGLVDEILSGTNVEDRVRASVSVLGRLAGSRAIVVAATHDLPIARAVDGAYDLYRFEDTGSDGMPSFDFKLRPGMADRRNALSILRSLGYDDRLLGSAPAE